jgi:RecG-like helicase
MLHIRRCCWKPLARTSNQGQDHHRHRHGDVRHGKTVVLQCNSFEVVNMGVMVPCHEILARARSRARTSWAVGLITPSLEEMQYVAAEMQKTTLPHPQNPY